MADNLDISRTLKILEEQIESLSEKIKSGRIKDPKNEEIKIKMIRTIGYLSKTYVQVKEAQIEELAQKVEELEKMVNNKEKGI
ncbi:MAG: hypothetical protein ACPK7O_09095 [Methanobacterium sp.]